ncbi:MULTISPECIES: glycosyltransferase family 2 protein [Brevibacterium]|uniref:Glycosyltransferase family 2 protein n=1 Tax=Brevibacterium casei TaxID=33889 RepID=A0A7T4DIJ6_9MICO|nr:MULTISPECIES: glycosyltransferase family 2 protein [Brevibacterium]QQB14632.1 glycosyltransferase family 2 protein [Brevibacterium casei]
MRTSREPSSGFDRRPRSEHLSLHRSLPAPQGAGLPVIDVVPPRRPSRREVQGLELPTGRRTPVYRVFEALPAVISYTAIALVFILPFIDPMVGAVYVLTIVGLTFVRALRGAVDVARGFNRYRRSARVDWSARLVDLERAIAGLPALPSPQCGFRAADHAATVTRVREDPQAVMRPSQLLHAVVVAAYNEPFDVIAGTIRTLLHTSTSPRQIVVFFAFEERGGPVMAETARRLAAEYGDGFFAFVPVPHPAGVPGEIAGKGANITHAGRKLASWVRERGIDPERVIVTSLDCDNTPHESYFDYVAYEYATAPDRARLSFQPISLYMTNIWDAPAPSRVVASANCFWNLTTTVRHFALRNFASHSQPLPALIDMGFWSTRTIVEDGHQYWRSWFHFDGDYRVVPIHVPIYQDAVLAGSFTETMVAQFKQLSRWSYGASDVPYVGVRVFAGDAKSPFWPGFLRFLSLLEGHVSLASISVIIAVGGWIPFVVASHTGQASEFIEAMPMTVGLIQQIGMIALLVSVLVFRALLPPRPVHVPVSRSVTMWLQWLLYPLTLLIFNAGTALYSQWCLLTGRYRERFDVTEKVSGASLRRAA